MTNHMTHISVAQLREMSQPEGEHLVSLYAPMQRAGREVRQNQIRWKNVLKEARQKLAILKISEAVIQQLLQPAETRLADIGFWQCQSDGLAFFLSPDGSKSFELPVAFEQTTTIGNRYHIRPLLAAFNRQHYCFILAASPKRVRLLKIDGQTVLEQQPENLPANLQNALDTDKYRSALRHHSTSQTGANGRQVGTCYGHGGSDPDVNKQEMILQFFRRLNGALEQFFAAEEVPLIFAGVEYLIPIFKQTCSCRNLDEQALTGNPDELSPDQLRTKTEPIMAATVERQHVKLISDYEKKADTDWASSDVAEVYTAAKLGQIETLLLSDDFSRSGHLDDSGHLNYITSSTNQNTNVDVVNLIVGHTFRKGGKAVSIPANRMPAGTNIAAIFRSAAGTISNETGCYPDTRQL